MGLWDALSGKVWHWNSTRLEVNRVVYPLLQAFPLDKHSLRDLFFASYFSFMKAFGTCTFSDHPEERARNYIGRVKSVNKNGFIILASSYFCDSIVRSFAGSQDEGLRNFGTHLINEACLLYGRDQMYNAQRLSAFANADMEMSAWLLGSEIALVLGLDPTSEWAVGPWLRIRDPMEKFTMACFRAPSWNVNVTAELSRPPRVMGYAVEWDYTPPGY